MNFAKHVALAMVLAGAGAGTTASGALAAQGSNVMAQAGVANAGIDQCSKTKADQALIDCIGGVLAKFAANIDRGEAKTKAPQIHAAIKRASDIRGKKLEEAVAKVNTEVSVLNAVKVSGFQPASAAAGAVLVRSVKALTKK